MDTIGLDLHKRESQLCTLTEAGEIVERQAYLSCLLDYGVPVFTDDVASSNYPVFRGPATLYALRMTPDGVAVVLTSSNARAGFPPQRSASPCPTEPERRSAPLHPQAHARAASMSASSSLRRRGPGRPAT